VYRRSGLPGVDDDELEPEVPCPVREWLLVLLPERLERLATILEPPELGNGFGGGGGAAEAPVELLLDLGSLLLDELLESDLFLSYWETLCQKMTWKSQTGGINQCFLETFHGEKRYEP
jgi:hypothetical protein